MGAALVGALTGFHVDIWESFRAVAAGPAGFVGVGGRGMIYHAPDGLAWQAANSGASVHLNDVAWGGGRWVAVGNDGTVLHSIDGLKWGPASADTNAALQKVIHGTKGFLAVGFEGTLLHSIDGETWRVLFSDNRISWSGAAVGHDRYIAVATDGTILLSNDAVNWLVGQSGPEIAFRDVRFGHGHFIAASYDGAIFTSVDGLAWEPLWHKEGEFAGAVHVGAERWLVAGSKLGAARLRKGAPLPWLAAEGSLTPREDDVTRLHASTPVGDGDPVQWFGNGEPIPGATAPILELTGAGFAEAGIYQFAFLQDGQWRFSNSVTLAPVGTYQDWSEETFGLSEPRASTAPAADPEGVGLPNLLRYALNLGREYAGSPLHPGMVRREVLTAAGRRETIGLEFTFQPGAEDLLLTVEASEDLLGWRSLGAEECSIYEQGPTRTMLVTPDVTDQALLFLRLRVELKTE